MVGIGKESHTKSNAHGKAANKGTDRKKKSLPAPPKIPSEVIEDAKSVIINNDSIDKLTIRKEELEELRKTLEGNNAVKLDVLKSKPFVVKKLKPVEKKTKHERTQNYLVAKVAPPNSPLKPIDSAPCGPRYTSEGHIVPHSILGTVQDFIDEAIRRKEMQPDSPAALAIQIQAGPIEVQKFERPKTPAQINIPTALDQKKALENWRRKMAERKRIQGHISNLLEKPLDRLVMSQNINLHRTIKETRNLLDRTIHHIDEGVEDGRFGCEFWKQTCIVGDDVDGLHVTLTRTQKGEPYDAEHIGKPVVTQKETGEKNEDENETVDLRKSWFDNKYLKKRLKQLQPFIDNFVPFKPDIDSLEVVGNVDENKSRALYTEMEKILPSFSYDEATSTLKTTDFDPLSEYPDVVHPNMVGPSILFDGIPAYWIGSSNCNKGQIGGVSRVNFECVAGNRTSSDIVVANNGTTAIYYEWRKIPYTTSLDSLQIDQTQRFYFNLNEGHILPGDQLTLSFLFKSSRAGIFTESWEFLTKPEVMGAATLSVVLKGIAVLDDSMTVAKRKLIEKSLDDKVKEYSVQRVVGEIVKGIQTPERARSPLDMYVTEKEIFSVKNPKSFYDFESVEELKEIYRQAQPPKRQSDAEWGFSLVELLTCVTTVPDEEKRNELLKIMNDIIYRISFATNTPTDNPFYEIAYSHWIRFLDKLVSCTMMLRASMELPEEVMTELITVPEIHDKKLRGKRLATKESKEEKSKKAKVNPKDQKDKERPKSTPLKGKSLTSSPTKEFRLISGEEIAKSTSRVQKKNFPSASAENAFVPAEDPLDPAVRKIYSQKIYGQVYSLLVEMVENMVDAFEDVRMVKSKNSVKN